MRGELIQAKCEKCESVETPITSQFNFWNSEAFSLKAINSVGHTNVLKSLVTLFKSEIYKYKLSCI